MTGQVVRQRVVSNTIGHTQVEPCRWLNWGEQAFKSDVVKRRASEAMRDAMQTAERHLLGQQLAATFNGIATEESAKHNVAALVATRVASRWVCQESHGTQVADHVSTTYACALMATCC